jgi:integrase
VKLFGKGRKEHICPLWPETAELLAALMKRKPRGDSEPVFVTCYGRPLGQASVRFKLAQYVSEAAKDVPSIKKKRISPHTFRHTVGVQMVAAGIDITVIRSVLGHVSLDTTNHYARANIETKRRALELVDRTTRPSGPPRWRKNPNLLDWLDSL